MLQNETPGKLKLTEFETPDPVNMEISFDYDELFFSISDHNSAITFVNDVFVQTSRYDEEEISGSLHKLNRHPDMPRSVFYLYRNYLEAGKPVAAYIKNLAKDGSFYWIMAVAFPCPGGFVSIGLKPGSELFSKIKSVYEQTLRHENEQEKTSEKKDAMISSHNFLLDELKNMGFADYDEFMWNALHNELNNRNQYLNKTGEKNNYHIPPELLAFESVLNELVSTLDQLKKIHSSLTDHSDYILKLSRSILLLALNAQVGSAKLNQQNQSLSIVAEKMGEQSTSGEQKLLEMQKNVFSLSELIGQLNFNISSSKLQVEMIKLFLIELSGSKMSDRHSVLAENKALQVLYDIFIPGIEKISDEFGMLPGYLGKLLNGVQEIERFLLVLRFIHIKGKVEIARMNDEAKSFSNTFQDLIQEVESAEKRLGNLSDLINDYKKTGNLHAGYKYKLAELGRQIKTLRNSRESEIVA